jgi:hypothetical protein
MWAPVDVQTQTGTVRQRARGHLDVVQRGSLGGALGGDGSGFLETHLDTMAAAVGPLDPTPLIPQMFGNAGRSSALPTPSRTSSKPSYPRVTVMYLRASS